MKIWTVTPNDDNGTPSPVICYTAAAADAAALDWVRGYWPAWMEDAPMPDDWRQALQSLTDQAGFMDSISVAEHDISSHPDLEGMTVRPSPEALLIWYEAPDLADGMITVADGGEERTEASNRDHVALICDWMKECGQSATNAALNELWRWIPDSLDAMQADIAASLEAEAALRTAAARKMGA